MAGEALVQTVLPRALGKWVKQQADEAGLSTAAWLRRLIMQAQSEVWVRAWSMHPGHRKANSSDWFASRSQSPPDILLERAAVHPDSTIEFRAFDAYARPGTPLVTEILDGAEGYAELRYNLNAGWLVLEGSTEPWTVVRKIADASAGGQVVLFVRTVKPSTTYYAYANAYSNPPLVGLATSDPPATGGVVFWQFETEEPDHQRRMQSLKVAPQFRLEDDRGQTIGTPRPATQFGLDEAVMEASALARVDQARVMRLVVGPNEAKVVLRSWPRTA
jgi:hypothetical protein